MPDCSFHVHHTTLSSTPLILSRLKQEDIKARIHCISWIAVKPVKNHALQNGSWESRRAGKAREAHWELGAAFDGAIGWCRGDAAFCAGRQVGASAEAAIYRSWQVLVRLIVPRILCKGHKAHPAFHFCSGQQPGNIHKQEALLQ